MCMVCGACVRASLVCVCARVRGVWSVVRACAWASLVCVCACARGTFETLDCSLRPYIATSFPCLDTTAGNNVQIGISVGLLLTRALER